MEDDFVYQIKIHCEDGMIVTIYTNGRKDEEDIILDFMWQKYYDIQPLKSKYKVSNLSKDFDEIVNTPPRVYQIHLAFKAVDYADTYN